MVPVLARYHARLLAATRTGADGGNGYFLAKAAGWAATNGLRLKLAEQKTQVTGVHIGVIDTDMSASWPGAKLDPIDVVKQITRPACEITG